MAFHLAALGAPGCLGVDSSEPAGGETVDAPLAAARAWTGSTSDEHPPIECASAQLISGVECSGNYCDNIRVDCVPTAGSFGASSWTAFFSEEGTNYRICGANQWVTGIACTGHFCDNISLECTTVNGKSVGRCSWSTDHSDESGPYQAPAGWYVRGVRCRGAFCDNMSYHVCELR
ncbi:hypothetical protein [Sorangium sp. So ce388]|uniref:hypothetical protein n=1 Tax=Sorangium sp. So ce388 TaxID=3133309 RepID=UPI003F5C7207